MILTPEGRALEVRSAPVDPSAIPLPGSRGLRHAGVSVTSTTAMQVDSVYTALRVITNAVIKMGAPRGYTTALDNQNQPYRKWLANQPPVLSNTFGDKFQFDGTARTIISMALFGEAFWCVLTRDYLQRPTAVEVLNPALVQPDHANPGRWLYGATGSKRKSLPAEDVVHIPFLAMPGAVRGLNSVDYAGIAFALALAAMEYGQSWFSQGASPSYLLSTDQKLGPEDVQRIAEKFAVEHSGLANAHLPLVVDSGLKVEKIQSTPDEAQYLATLQYARMVIAAWFGLPSHLVGGTADKGNVWGKTVEEQGLQFVDYTLSGYVVRLDEAYSSLLPRGTFAALDENAVIRANAVDRAAEIQALRTAGVETKNEIRVNLLKMAPLPGGDELMDPLNSNAKPVTPTGKPDPQDPPQDEEAA